MIHYTHLAMYVTVQRPDTPWHVWGWYRGQWYSSDSQILDMSVPRTKDAAKMSLAGILDRAISDGSRSIRYHVTVTHHGLIN